MSVEINIYLHGFFFVEIQKEQLVIASPKYEMHKFGYWDDQERKWYPFPSQGFDWSKVLFDGNEQSFPKDILQFSRDNLGLKAPFIQPPDGKRQYAVYLELPLPADITSTRDGGDLSELKMMHGNVEASVHGHCGQDTKLSLISCLTYEAPGPLGFTDINFYAEHCIAPEPAELEDLFKKTRDEVFPNFDLDLDLGKITPPKRKLKKPESDNERTLCELGTSLQNNPCKASDCRTRHTEMLRTANCPQFGIVQT